MNSVACEEEIKMAENTMKFLEELVNLVSRKIDKIAKKFRSRPAKYAPVADQLDALSKTTQKLASDCAEAIRSLPEKEREELLSSFERSGAVDVTKFVTVVFETENLFDDCLALHEYAKALAAAAYLAELAEIKPLAALFNQLSVAADIAAQACDDQDSQLMQQKIDFIMELPDGVDVPPVPSNETPTSLTTLRKLLQGLEQKIDFIMDLPPGVAVPPVPKDETPTSLTALRKLLEVAKKFYKFEGSFKPT